MDTSDKQRRLELLAEEVFELTELGSRARAQARKGDSVEALTETENLTLDLLIKHKIMTVGEIQQAIGVLPAQMSRIIRALEDKGGTAMIQCSINAKDRRKIDVRVTKEGKAAFDTYKSARLALTMQVLSILTQRERDDFMRILRKMRENISKNLPNK